MPKINFKEIDLTNELSSASIDYNVLIPGTANNISFKDEENVIYLTKESELSDYIGDDSDSGYTNLSYKMAKELLNKGLKVLYAVVDSSADLGSYDNFWKRFEDKGKWDIFFICTGMFTSSTIVQNAIKCAAERGDAVAIVDTPSDKTATTDIDAFANELEVEDVTRYDGTKEDPFKYSANFAPEFSFKGEENTLFPVSFGYLNCFATHIQRFPAWFAMAGSVRGVLPFEKVTVSEKFGDADVEVLQDRTTKGHKATNVICEIRPYGNIVWGNRTLFPNAPADEDNPDDSRGILKASSFLNVRILICILKKVLYRAARRFTFEPNSDVLWTNFTSAIKPTLEEMRSGQGIKGYKIIKEVGSRATLKARIQIIPIEAVEDFDLTVELTDSIVVTE